VDLPTDRVRWPTMIHDPSGPPPATDPALASRALAVTPPSPPQARPPSRSACPDRAAATRRGIHLPGCHLGASASSLDECSQTADTRLAPRQRTMLLRTNHGQEVRRQGDKSAEDLLEHTETGRSY
jgi:hypothetical protein